MAIIQISRIQHRTGANVDLPQLSEGELGFATDERRLYIGNDPTLHPPAEGGTTTQTEVLTEVSLLNFAKIDGAANTTFNVSDLTDGQLLVSKDYAWVNGGGPTSTVDINLGNADYLKILGGTNGSVLQTDGTGSLTWTNPGVLTYVIADISKANPAVVTTKEVNQLSTGTPVTIVDVQGMTDLLTAGVSGTSKFYVNVLDSTHFSLYTSSGIEVAATVDSTGFSTYTVDSGIVITSSDAAKSFGANNQIQIGDGSGGFKAFANLKFLSATNTLEVRGTATVTGQLSAATLSGTITTPSQINITNVGTLRALAVTANTTTGNIAVDNIATVTGNLTAGNLITAGTVSATDLAVTGTVTTSLIPSVDLTYDLGSPAKRWKDVYMSTGKSIFIGTQQITADATSVTMSDVTLSSGDITGVNEVVATFLTGELTVAAQPKITTVGNLTSLNVEGIANLGPVANVKILGGSTDYVLTTAGDGSLSWQPPQMGIAAASGANSQVQFNDNGSISADSKLTFDRVTGVLTSIFSGNGAGLSNITGANVTGAVAFATTANSVAGANVTGAVAFATTANSVAGANVTGAVFYANIANRIAGANVTGFVANAVRAVTADSASSVVATNITGQVANALVSGTVYTNAQPNITSVGTLTSVTSIGNVSFSGANISLGAVSNVRILGGTAGYVLRTDGIGNLSWVAQSAGSGGGAVTNPGGDDTQVQFNSAGSFAGSSGLTYNNSTKTLSVDYIIANGVGLTSIAGANVTGEVTFAATANAVTGSNVSGAVAFATTANAVTGSNVSGQVSFAATANSVAGSNVSGAVAFATTANAVAGSNVSGQVPNALVAGTVYTAAQPSITSVGTLTSLTVTGSLSAGDATISGNLTVSGVTITANVETMVVKDPIIEQGGDTTGVLTTNDGKDRGQLLHYYDTDILPSGAATDAFMGWNTANKEFRFGSNVSVTGDVVTFNTLGNVRAGNFIGNVSGNIIATSTANLGAVANVTITGGTSGYMLSTDGSGVLSWQNPKSAPGTDTQVQFNDGGVSNTSSALTFDKNTGRLTATAFYGSAAGLTNIPAANVTGTVASATSATTAGTVTASAQSSITSVGILTELRVDGNLTSNGNLIVTRLANLGPLSNVTITGGTAGYVIQTDGTGILSWVAQPDVNPGGASQQVQFNDAGAFGGDTKLTFSKTTGILTANVFSGNGAALTNLNASNVVGTVATATSATTAGSATTATTAGTVTTAAQPTITSVGVLNGLTVHTDGQYIIPEDITSGIWDPDILVVTGHHGARHGMYFSSDSSGFTILSDPNQNGTGIYVFDANDKFAVVNNGYVTTTIDSVGSILPSTENLAQNLGGIAGSVGGISGINGTPAGAIDYATSFIIAKAVPASPGVAPVPGFTTSGSGTGALFEVYTIPASVGGQVYQVRVAALGSGYAAINKIFGSTTSTTLVVNSTADITAQMAVTGAGFTAGQRVVTVVNGTTLTLTAAADSATSASSILTFNDTVTIDGSLLNGASPTNDLTFTIVPTAELHWKNLYVGDATLKNSVGDWTLMAGADGLYLYNNSTGNKYLITMTAVGAGTGPDPLGV